MVNKKRIKIKEIRENLKYKKYALGKELIEKYIDEYGTDCYVELERARYYHYLSDYEEAIKILNNLIETAPKNIGYVLFELAKLYEEKKDYKEAIKTYTEIENTNHKNKEYSYYALGIIYENLFDNVKAIHYFKKVIIDENNLSEGAKLHIARNYIYMGQYEKARSYLKKVSTNIDHSLNCQVKFYEARLENQLGNKEKYIEMINDLVSYYPNSTLALSEKAHILFSQKRYEEGKKILAKIHLSNEDQKEYCGYKILYADYYEKTCQYSKALKVYEHLLNDHYPELKPAEISRIKLGVATCYIGLGKINEGYEMFKKQNNSSNFHRNACIFSIISIEIYRGNYEEAYKLLQEASDLEKINERDVYDLKLMLSKFISITPLEKRPLVYREKQIVNYQKNLAAIHINSGHGFNNAPNDEGFINPDINISDLIGEVKSRLSDDNIITLNIFKKHKIYYKNVGIFDGEPLDYLLVVTPLYANDIITMYPTNQLLIKKMETKPKEKIIKRVSQIEKFNRRYNQK